ncbi:hypothetical protein CONLIGDRAFT_566845 [Coniochaeta ligniaria NRRL 30616]|uniref:Zn(2)-C6 fungal-type domain-containing protein n=1 Tax=Coniochaeta ligniaria NRRL 30616 TaxID=1408157 RepID=A0A1J7J2Q4_9PEZI|nr:hypothetical protein CONLIGDRAFT_566845 [Coniochaeta ligniaria NRRL 30616]
MTPTPSSTTPSSGGGRSPEEQFRVVRKRNRVPLSCYPCRTRKKCDRSHPCSNCVKREGAGTSACSYASPSSRKKSQNQGASSPDDMQNRIDRLEGLVLSLMHGGANIDPPEWKGRTLELAAEYRLRTVQCLMTGDYTKPSEYTVETMVLYIFGEYSSRWDADLALWLINSLITRLALRMGYHRDGKWFPSISPFQAEMRRRTWALVRMSDVMFSHQVSLPSMIYEHDCDTELPSNIFDEEFGPETKVLPPSRPSNEPTPISYMIAKIRLCLELGNILQATGRVKNQVHYDDILRFDARLREIKEELPQHLKMQPLEGSQDPLTLIIARFNIDILYLRIMCLLHRKYMSRARHNPRYAHSRRSAIEASMETLKHLANLHRESQPSGRLRSIKWYVSSIATKDFVLPAMLVILDLHYDSNAERAAGLRQDSQSQYFWTPEQRADMIRTLEVTRAIWAGLADDSMEAMKASNILELMLERIKKPQPPVPVPTSALPPPGADVSLRSANLFAAAEAELQPEHSAAMTLGMLSGGVSPNTAAAAAAFGGGGIQSPGGSAYPNPMDLGMGGGGPPGGEQVALPDFSTGIFGLTALGSGNPTSPFSTMFGALGGEVSAPMPEFGGGNFDWDSLENYTQTANWGTDQNFQFFPANPEEQGGGASSESNIYTPSSGSSRPT